MRYTFAFTLLLLSTLCLPAAAQTFTDALGMAYQSNPMLRAAQAELRALDSGVTEAQSGWRPSAQIDGSYGYSDTRSGGSIFQPPGTEISNPRDVTASITQPVFRGGRTVANTEVAKAAVMAGRANLTATEQDVLLSSATAYLDVLRDEGILKLNQKNEDVLREQLSASESRFKVGDVTKTDVSQSESRLARARADRIQAEGNLNITRATFARLVGQPPADLTPPVLDIKLPETLEETISLAEANSPLVLAAINNDKAASANIDAVRGNLLPEVNIVASSTRAWDQSPSFDTRGDTQKLMGQVSLPLYKAGADYARLKAARESATQRKLLVDDARLIARQRAVAAWESLQAARAGIKAREAQQEAAQLALTGVREESKVGTRTTLDVLDAEQELLDARVGYTTADRDLKVASLQVMQATGQMTAARLGLNVPVYDPVQNYDDVDGAWFGE